MKIGNLEIKKEYLFVLKLLVIYLVLKGLETWLQSSRSTEQFLGEVSSLVATHSGILYSWFGVEYYVEGAATWAKLFIDGVPAVNIAYSCNGVSLMVVFLTFMFATANKSKHAFWFIPAGLLVIHLVNVLRVTLLAKIARVKPEWVDFNHKYVFTVVVYSAIIVLFLLWSKYFINKEKQSDVVA